MHDGALAAVPLLLALTAAQFGVHAIGWTMAAVLFRRPRGPEGHFALSWYAAAAAPALGLATPASGSSLRAVAFAAIVVALLLAHRGFALFGGRRPADRAYAMVVLLLLAASLWWQSGGDLALAPATAGQVGWLIAAFFAAGLFNLVQIRVVLGRVLERLLAQSRLDELTGVANRRGALSALRTSHERAARAGQPFGLLMVDVDHFKSVNDRFGHAAGDAALVRVARCLVEGVRIGDVVGRWGGEEFCVLLPRCDAGGAELLAERLRAAVAASGKAGEPALTISIGIALIDAAHESIDRALARADAALYDAKAAGRDRSVVAAAPAVAINPTPAPVR